MDKCKNEDCTIKQNCFRYTAKPHKYRQSYFSPDEKDCDYFIDINEL